MSLHLPFRRRYKGRVLFVGQSYYHAWYLSRELRKLGWKADVLNWDPNPASDLYYHGEDFRLKYGGDHDLRDHALFFARAALSYDIFHFSNINGIAFSRTLELAVAERYGRAEEIRLLKRLGKKIVYSHSGCRDGVTQTSFDAWGPEPTCEVCPWRNNPDVCSDALNIEWGEIRNELADYQATVGGNRVDYNDVPSVHELPQFYCLDPDVWRPDLPVPVEHRLPYGAETLKLYHAVGNASDRVAAGTRQSLKSTHLWFALAKQLKSEGRLVELVWVTDVPNRVVRYFQLQSDMVCDMLTYGWFGANIREAMMLGRPAVAYLRPAWIESVRREVPGYVEELPVVNATPETVRSVVEELAGDPDRRRELGEQSREFAVKWHSSRAGANRFDAIYSELLES